MKIVYTKLLDDGTPRLYVIDGAPIEQFSKVVKSTNELGEEIEYLAPLTEDEYKTHVWETSVPPDAINPMEVDPKDLPVDREFRNALKHDGKAFGYDLAVAKELQLTRLRYARDKILDHYDRLMARAVDLNDTQAISSLKLVKQQLRDVTNPLKDLQPASIDDIKSATPDLGGYTIE